MKSFTIFEYQNEENSFDQLRLFLMLPGFRNAKGTCNWTGQPTKYVGFTAPTEISWSIEEEIGWVLTFQILGFGICINRQWSY
jgi:hypothetical protein